mgnify:FL=1
MGSLCPLDSQQAATADKLMEWTNSRFMRTFFPIFWGLIRTPKEDQDIAQVRAAAQATGELLKIVEQQLEGKKFIIGDNLTMGDIPLGSMLFKYFTLDIDRPSFPNIEAWYARLCERDAYRAHAMNPFGKNNEEWLALEKAGE